MEYARRNAFGFALLSAAMCCGIVSQCSGADVVATWDNSFLNNWSDSTRWTTSPDVSPIVPNNGATSFDVVIAMGNVVQDVAGGVTVSNLQLTDAFLSGSEPLTIVGDATDPLAVSTWDGLTQNSEIWNTGGVNVGTSAALVIAGSGFKGLGAPDNTDGVGDIAMLRVDGRVSLASGGLLANGEGAWIDIAATGTFDWRSDADFIGFGNGIITNAGTLTKSAGADIGRIASNWTLTNTRKFLVEAGTVQFSPATNGFTNDGTVEVSGTGATLQIGGGKSTGTIDVAENSTLIVSSSNITVKQVLDGAAAGISNAGALIINGYIDFTNGASLTGDGSVHLDGGALGGDVAIELSDFTWTGGQIGNTAGVTIAGGSTAEISGSSQKGFAAGARLIVAGTAMVNGTGDLQTVAPTSSRAVVEIVEGGVLDIQTNADFTSANQSNRRAVINNEGKIWKSVGGGVTRLTSAWTVENSGTFDVDTGTLQLDGAFTHRGVVGVAEGATAMFNGAVGGDGGFAGEGMVQFNHSYSPGVSPAGVGFGGDVVFGANSDLLLEIGGIELGKFDSLAVTGELTFQGDLHVSLAELLPGEGLYEPEPGDTFELISFGGLVAATNPFAGATLPPAPAMTTWRLDLTENSLLLSLVEVLQPAENGDFNGDLEVNLSDYTIWRDNFGAGDGVPGSLAVSDGDANGDGMVDIADYGIWAAQFGNSLIVPGSQVVAGATTIPEPRSLLTMVCVTVVANLCRRKLLSTL